MTLNDLKRQFTAVVRIMRVLTKRLRLESRGFRYNVALYLGHQQIKFNDKTKGNSFEFQVISYSFASKVKVTSRFGFICSQISQLLRLVTQIYGNERKGNK